ncbi:hypothetical protein [Hyphobacterium sp.]|uniref:hypothetical protein n=1 Tax=Hyphobacterium sp. TaxID=2004662 RepID=UPI003BADBB05
MKSIVTLLSLSAALLASPILHAQSPQQPQFAVQTTSTGIIQLSARKFERGDYRQAAAIALQATERGLTRQRRSAAWANLCAARAMQGQAEAALAACETALELNASWEANNNYAVVLLQAGQVAEAQRHLAIAHDLEPDAAIVAANQSFLSSRTLAAAQ